MSKLTFSHIALLDDKPVIFTHKGKVYDLVEQKPIPDHPGEGDWCECTRCEAARSASELRELRRAEHDRLTKIGW